MKTVLRKIKELLMCFIPMVLYSVSQVAGIALCLAINMINMYKKTGYLDFYSFREAGMSGWQVGINSIALVSEIVTLVVAAIFYYGVMKGKDLKRFSKTFSAKSVPAILLLMVGAQSILSIIITSISPYITDAMTDYNELMELVDTSSMWGLLTVVLMAPIAEEILFRGMTFKYARRFTSNFWVANIIQALLFGLLHMNLIQSSYAFIVGLLLGIIYRKYNSLTATIVAHFGFNFLGSVVVSVIQMIGLPLVLEFFIVLLAGIVGMYVAYRLMAEDPAIVVHQKEYDEMAIIERVRYREKIDAHTNPVGSVPEMNFNNNLQKDVDK